MKFKYQDSVDTQAVLDENDEMIIKALNQIKEEEKELKEQKAKYENQIKNKLGENQFGISQNYQVSWKPQNHLGLIERYLKKNILSLTNNTLEQQKVEL